MQLGPDPLRPGLRPRGRGRAPATIGAGRETGDALLDQRIIAGIGNAIRVEALFQAADQPVAPGRRARADEEAERMVAENER